VASANAAGTPLVWADVGMGKRQFRPDLSILAVDGDIKRCKKIGTANGCM